MNFLFKDCIFFAGDELLDDGGARSTCSSAGSGDGGSRCGVAPEQRTWSDAGAAERRIQVKTSSSSWAHHRRTLLLLPVWARRRCGGLCCSWLLLLRPWWSGPLCFLRRRGGAHRLLQPWASLRVLQQQVQIQHSNFWCWQVEVQHWNFCLGHLLQNSWVFPLCRCSPDVLVKEIEFEEAAGGATTTPARCCCSISLQIGFEEARPSGACCCGEELGEILGGGLMQEASWAPAN